jgi:DNA (cytosine-5)-methyltransferase 1
LQALAVGLPKGNGIEGEKSIFPELTRARYFLYMHSKAMLSSVEIFSGAGGLALGVAAAGFEHRLLLEYNRAACETLRANRDAFGAACTIHEGDVKSFDFTPFKGVDLLAAGAPCQPFSIGGKHRAHSDERNLFPQVFRAQRELKPKAVLVENVKGLLRTSLDSFVEYIELQLAHPSVLPTDPFDPDGWESHLATLREARASDDQSKREYDVHRVLLNAANFGVPQRRERVFFVAIRSDIDAVWNPPIATHSQAALRLAMDATGEYWLRHAIRRKSSPTHPRVGRWMLEAGKTLPWTTVRDVLAGLPAPPVGAEPIGVRNHVAQPGARSYPGHTGSPMDAPAKTLKAGVHGVPGGENMLRNTNGTVRYFTVREAARIQTFPDHYVFKGAWGEAMRQIGNAVPVLLAQAVAASIRACILAELNDSTTRGGSRRRQLAYSRSHERAQQELIPTSRSQVAI